MEQFIFLSPVHSLIFTHKNAHTFPMCFLRPDLDACDSPEKYPQLFHVILDVEVESVDKQKDLTPPWEQFPCKDLSPNVLFSCHQEHQDALAIAGTLGTCAHANSFHCVLSLLCMCIMLVYHIAADNMVVILDAPS